MSEEVKEKREHRKKPYESEHRLKTQTYHLITILTQKSK
ncbi:MAG: hypothetical protein OBKJMPBA_00010 [Methanophagales virus PBV304]|uniref:Uncharacterized protein n=1 Tax=Methanophagales virus PBV304 TaxID=3071309 RepID=A0AA46TDX2_9VIRU|nr:MAG: hypothetical protein QIT47_gp10 [Methanophagales virus PBV304]UYL65042.1 MAG: hypothetical protein OBKJMPBA_00010 [Methanophagales virus PBV304]